MAKNVRALTHDELVYFNSNYQFELAGEYVAVSVKDYNRQTLHSIHEAFFISAKPRRTDSVNSIAKPRRINISVKAIDLWINKFSPKYNLVEVQNAINTLIVTYQDVSEDTIRKQLDINRK